MEFDARKWFGLTLLAGLFFLWCLVSQIEAAQIMAGWMWGIVVFGLITIVAAAMSLIKFLGQGNRFSRAEVLTRVEPSAAPRAGFGRAVQGSDTRLMGHGDVPRQSSGRNVLR